MAWHLKFDTPSKVKIYEAKLKAGRIAPENRRPELGRFSFYASCYTELETTKHKSERPLNFLSIYEFARITEVDNFQEFLYLMRRMDFVKLGKNSGKNDSNENDKNS